MSRWFRFDCDAVRHPKVVQLNDAEFRVWVEAISYAAEHGTDGKIGRDWFRVARIPDEIVARLLEVGLLEDRDGSLWLHDYLDHQPPAERWSKASAAGRKAAAARWSRGANPGAESGAECGTHSEPHTNRNAVRNATSTNTNTKKEGGREKKASSTSSSPLRDDVWREIFAALRHVTSGDGQLTKAEQGKLAQAADQLRTIGATAGEVVTRGEAWRTHYSVPLTAPALVRNWSSLAPKRARTQIGRFGESRVIGGAA